MVQLIYTAAFVVLMLLAWVLVCKMSASAGWSKLHRDFPGTEEPAGEYFRFVFMSIAAGNNWSYYGGRLSVIFSNAGLYIKPICSLLVFFHPPIYIPWHAISPMSSTDKTERFPNSIETVVQTSDGEVKMVFRGKIAMLITKCYVKT